MKLGAVFFVGNLTCSFHMLHTWPTQFYVGPPTSTFLAMLVLNSAAVTPVLKKPNLDPSVPFRGNFELRLLGVAMGNVVSVTRV